MVSLDGSVLFLASKVTVRGEAPLVGFADAMALTVYLLVMVSVIFASGALQFW